MEDFSTNTLKNMPLYKWIFLLIGGTFLFLILYSTTQITGYISENVFLSYLLIIGAIVALIAIYIGFIKVVEKKSAKEIELSIGIKDVGKGFLVGSCYITSIILIMMILGCYSIDSFQFDTKNIILRLLFFLLVAVGEEVVLRGVIFRYISLRWNYVIALIISALLFGYIHISNDNATIWSSLAIAIEAGLMLGAAYMCSGTLWFPIGIHWAWNFFEGNVFGTPVSGSIEITSIFTSSISGSDIITGGPFGPEASVISVFLGVAVTAWFIYIYKKSSNQNIKTEI